MKILHTADIHLKKIDDARWSALKTLMDIGKKEKIELFLISGDLFDKNIDASILKGSLREIFSKNPFKIVVCPGNHDSNCFDENYYFGDDVIVLKNREEKFIYKDVEIRAIPFKKNLTEEEVLEEIDVAAKNLNKKNTNILLYHGELIDASFSRDDFGEEEPRYMPVKLSYFKDFPFDYILAGHFHTNFEIRQFQKNKYFVYPGSPVSITKKEKGLRKVNLFETGKTPEEISVDTFHYEEILINFDHNSDTSVLDEIDEKVRIAHPKAEILLVVKGFFNPRKLNMNEKELHKKIEKIIEKKGELRFEVQEIEKITSDELFVAFEEKLKTLNAGPQQKKRILNYAINAFIKIKS